MYILRSGLGASPGRGSKVKKAQKKQVKNPIAERLLRKGVPPEKLNEAVLLIESGIATYQNIHRYI